MCFFSKRIVIALVVFTLASSQLFAAFYRPGDYNIGLRIPLTIPAFTSLREEDATTGEYKPRMLKFSEMGFKNIVAGIEVDFGIFMTSNLSIGGLLGYNFAYDRGDKLFSRVPMLFKANFIAYSSYRIDVPISLILGVNYFKYRSMEHFVIQTGIEVGLNVFWDDHWGATFRSGFWLYPELYANSNKNNLSGFIPIVVGVTFRR